jgi:hypothetical protein
VVRHYRHFLAYLKALKPERQRSIVLGFLAFLLTPAGAAVLIATGYRPQRHEWLMLIVIELSVVVILLVVFGFIAWSGEQRRADRAVAALSARWRGLSQQARLSVVSALKGTAQFPEFYIYNSGDADCRRLGADLFHAISEIWSVPIPPIVHQVPLASGITIVARPDEARAALLQAALRNLGIEVEIETAANATFNIQIGPKI